MVLELVAIAASLSTVTSYRSVPAQTDSTPFHTSIGERTHPGGCAVSPDLLHSVAPYGTYLFIEGVGICRVNDTTHPRHRNLIDIWVPSYQAEKAFGVKKARVYRIKVPTKEQA